jgi:hypothetical protein
MCLLSILPYATSSVQQKGEGSLDNTIGILEAIISHKSINHVLDVIRFPLINAQLEKKLRDYRPISDLLCTWKNDRHC